MAPAKSGLAAPLSTRMQQIDSSEIRRLFELGARLKDPINLSIGQPHFSTPVEIVEAAQKALGDGKTAYTVTQGISLLREKLAWKFRQRNHFETHPDNILVSAGVSALIQLLFLVSLEAGDRILLTDPAFLIYRSLARFLGAKIELIPEDFDLQAPERINPDGLKMIVVCSPSNPSGHIMSGGQLSALARLSERSGALLVSDEIYELYDYDGRFQSAAAIYPPAVTLMGFSKSYSMTGLRLAAASGPKEIIGAMTTLQQYTVVCASAPVQYAGIAALDCDMSQQIAAYRSNRNLCLESLQGRRNFIYPAGAFYMFLDIGSDDSAFVERAIEERQLLVVPGRIFSPSRQHIRISYATDRETLQRGLQALMYLLG